MSDEHGSTPTWLSEVEGRGGDVRGRGGELPANGALPAGAESRPADGASTKPPPAAFNGAGPSSSPLSDLQETGLVRLKEDAARVARQDAASGLPSPDREDAAPGERDVRERCRAFFERWVFQQRRWMHEQVAEHEERINDKLGRAALSVDRYERQTNELMRLKARRAVRPGRVAAELGEKGVGGDRGIPTRIYIAAIGFLGVVEFFANAPVFSALLPRDPLTERQIRLVAETSQGWFAGAERVVAHLILRPDAALLAAGVVTFLCVLAHFFGHSLRELIMQHDTAERHHTVSSHSRLENVIPMALTGVGLMLVLGVLYEARIRLGQVGQEQYQQDVAVVSELRRQAEFQRTDANLLEANALLNRADDMEAAAVSLRDYADSMSRLSFPILLLNMTLVICAICAAYFHRRDRRREHFNENPFERERRTFIESAERSAQEVTSFLSDLAREIRELRSLGPAAAAEEQRGLVRELETVVSAYRTENARARELDPMSIRSFRDSIALEIPLSELDGTAFEPLQRPEEYDQQRRALQERFEVVRRRFNEEAIAW